MCGFGTGSFGAARRCPEAVPRQLRGSRHQPGNQVRRGDRQPGIQDPYPEIVVADDPARYRHPRERRMRQESVAREIQRRAQGRVMLLLTQALAVPNLA